MKTLLEFILQYVGFLYLDPKYRITDSTTRGLPDIDASVSFSFLLVQLAFAMLNPLIGLWNLHSIGQFSLQRKLRQRSKSPGTNLNSQVLSS